MNGDTVWFLTQRYQHDNRTDRRGAYKRNVERRSCKHFGIGIAISITYSECVCVCVCVCVCACVCVCNLRDPACDAHALYYHQWPARLYNILPHYLTDCTISGKKKFLNTKRVFWFCTNFSEIFGILRRTERDIIIVYVGLHVKYPLFFSGFNDTWTYSTYFRKIFKYQVPLKPTYWGPSSSVRRDRRTDRKTGITNLIVASRNFAKAPKNVLRPCFLFLKICQILYDFIYTVFPSNIRERSVVSRDIVTSNVHAEANESHKSSDRKTYLRFEIRDFYTFSNDGISAVAIGAHIWKEIQ